MGLTNAADTFVKQYAEFLAKKNEYPEEAARAIPSSLAVDLAYAVKVGFDMGRRLEIERAYEADIVSYHGGSSTTYP